MKTKLIKILILIIAITLLFGSSQVFALDPDYYDPSAYASSSGDTLIKAKVGKILGVISSIGVVCSVVVIMVIGLKYMVGSVDEKAEYKKKMITYMTGAVLLFTGTTIPNIIYEFVNGSSQFVYFENGTGAYYTETVDWCYNCNLEYGRGMACEIKGHQKKPRNVPYCAYCDNELSTEEETNQRCSDCN